jgi:uncharacterized protein YjbI with pentapeptide repeats
MREAIFDHAHLVSADLREVSLFGARLRRCNLHLADFRNAMLQSAILEQSYLRGADLRGANLKDANFRGARLPGTFLEDAKVEGADFTGSRADRSTTWPEGFDPKAAGVIFSSGGGDPSHG